MDRNQIACQVSYRTSDTTPSCILSEHSRTACTLFRSQPTCDSCLDPAQELFYAMVLLWLPSTSQGSEFFHHQGKEASKVVCQHVHLFNTTSFSAYLIKGAAIQSKPGDARTFSLRINLHTTGYRSKASGSSRVSGSGIHPFCPPC